MIWIPNPERGATRPYVPGGHAIDKSVATRAFPFAGTTVSSDLLVRTSPRRPAERSSIPTESGMRTNKDRMQRTWDFRGWEAALWERASAREVRPRQMPLEE